MVTVTRGDGPRVLPGSLITLRRKCGKPGCRCATGSPHETPALSYSVGGRTKMLTLTPDEVPAVSMNQFIADFSEFSRLFRYRRWDQASARRCQTSVQYNLSTCLNKISANRSAQNEAFWRIQKKVHRYYRNI